MWRFGFQTPKICLSFPAKQIQNLPGLLKRYAGKADLYEIRLDWIKEWSVDDFGFVKGRPILWTCRPKRHGGEYRGEEGERLKALLSMAKMYSGSWVDLEHDVPVTTLEQFRPYAQVLLSYHHFREDKPPNYSHVFDLLKEKPHDAVKVAVSLSSMRDIVGFLEALNDHYERLGPGVWVIMGESASWFRILAPWFGSLWTYTTPQLSQSTTGAGQVPIEFMRHIYRYTEMKPDHLLFAVIGHPISHSLSPYLHNLALRELGIYGHYIAIDVDDLDAFWRLTNYLPLRGFSVTSPHKESIRSYIDRLDEHARLIGAVNTVTRWEQKTGGFNTDWGGFLRPLKRITGRSHWMPLIIGAGGAARAVAYAFWKEQLSFLITNRTMDKAETIARRFDGKAISWDAIDPGMFDLLIHATPVGMAPHHRTSLNIPESWLAGKIVYDLVYRPFNTKLLTRAKRAGALMIIPGVEMLVEQAWEQLQLWVNMAPSQDFLMSVAKAYLEQMDETASLF